jgi:hypothetical protein
MELTKKLNTKLGASVVGGLFGASAFGFTLFAAPAIIHAAAAPVATALAVLMGQTVATYLTAMVAVGVAAVLASALLAMAIQMLVNAIMSKLTKAPEAKDPVVANAATLAAEANDKAPVTEDEEKPLATGFSA